MTFTLLLSGCVTFPILEKTKYPSDKTSFIKQNITNQDEILNQLGEPDVIRKNNSIWLYGDSHAESLFFVFGEIGIVRNYRWIFIQFDGELVKNVEFFNEPYGCTTTDICLTTAWVLSDSDGNPIMTNDTTALLAPLKNHELTKKPLNPGSMECGVILYINNLTDKMTRYIYSHIGRTQLSIIDTNIHLVINEGGYAFLKVQPGVHRVEINNSFMKQAEPSSSINISCTSGEIIFLEIRYFLENWTLKTKMFIASEAEGMSRINKLNLLLSH